MGKVKPRSLGLEEVEEKQKKKQKEKAAEKKMLKKKSTSDVGVDHDRPVSEKKEIKSVKKTSFAKALKVKPKEVKVKSRGKKYKEAIKLIDKTKLYSVETAVSILKKIKITKFDESVELHFVVDETGLKGEVELPHSTGKVLRIAVVDDKILADLEKGKIAFDIS